MGGSGLKRKSSKKKSDDVSSQKTKKKKGLKKYAKKRRRIEHSVSSSSTGDSSDSEYTSSSTSTSDYKRKKNKSNKRRRIKSSVSSDTDISSSADSDSLSSDDRTRKTKKARKSRILVKSKKRITRKRYPSTDDETYAKNSRKRKRPSKDLSIKSRKKYSKKKSRKKLSSDSESYSTCPSSRSGDDNHARKVSGGKEIERWASDVSYKGRKKRNLKSPSCSSCSRSNSDKNSVGIGQNYDVLSLLSNNPLRLKSVIFVPDRTLDELGKDSNKDEIVYDRDDYPAPKSLDSDEEQYKGESDDYSQREPIEKIHLENIVSELTNDGKQINKDHSHSVHIKNLEKKTEVDSPASVVASGGDLESTLRQKALENLLKFRVGHKGHRAKSHGTSSNEIHVTNDFQNESKNPERSNALEMEQTSGPASNKEFSQPAEFEKCSLSSQQKHLEEAIKISTDSHSALVNSSSKSEIIQGPETSDSCNANKKPVHDNQNLPKEQNLEEHRNKSSNGSEFEEKTMSVMRGGEMVQVSYKVYVPKKTPALTRRQLRR